MIPIPDKRNVRYSLISDLQLTAPYPNQREIKTRRIKQFVVGILFNIHLHVMCILLDVSHMHGRENLKIITPFLKKEIYVHIRGIGELKRTAFNTIWREEGT